MDTFASAELSPAFDSVAAHPSLQPCVGWFARTIAETGRPPTRSELDPIAFGRHLDCVMLLEYHCGDHIIDQHPVPENPVHEKPVEGPGVNGHRVAQHSSHRAGVRVRLVGSKVNAVLERELGNAYLADFIASTDDPYLKPDCGATCDFSPDQPTVSAHAIALCDGRTGTYSRLAFPLAPLPTEAPMAVVVFLDMTIGHAGCSGRSLRHIRGPLWIDRH